MKKSLILAAILACASAQAGWQDAVNQGAQALGAASSGDYKSAVSSALNAAVKELSNSG